jgi:hypothetical protein
MNHGFWRGLGGGGGIFWLYRVTLTFKIPAALQATILYEIGEEKKILQTLTHYLRRLYKSFSFLKGSLCDIFSRPSALTLRLPN